MDFLKIKPEYAPLALQALTMDARAAMNGLTQPHQAMLDAMQRLVLETDQDIQTLQSVTPEELALHLKDPAQARQIVRLMVATSLADGKPSMQQIKLIDSFSASLNVEEPSVRVIVHLAKNHLLRFRLAFFRHAHVHKYFKNTRRMQAGLFPVIKTLLRFKGVIGEDKALADRFRALGELPKDTLGYHFYQHCNNTGIGFPGEVGGFALGGVFHDFVHIDRCPFGALETGNSNPIRRIVGTF